MILTCPNCSSRFVVDPVQLGPTGRRVRCARCGHTWHADPTPPAQPEPVRPPPLPQPRPGFGAALPPPPPEIDDADLVTGPLPDITQRLAAIGAARRPDVMALRREDPIPEAVRPPVRGGVPALAPTPPKGPPWVALGFVSLLLLVTILIGAVLAFPTEVSSAWPPARRLYDALGMLAAPEDQFAVRDLAAREEQATGELIVTGTIVNLTGSERQVPGLDALVQGPQGALIGPVRIELTATGLGGGAVLPFEARLPISPSVRPRLSEDLDGNGVPDVSVAVVFADPTPTTELPVATP